MYLFLKVTSLNPTNDNPIIPVEQPKHKSILKRTNPSHIAIAQHSQNVTLPVLPTIGYCLMFKRKTKYCKLSISKDKNELEVIISDGEHNETLSKHSPTKSQLHFKEHHPFLIDLFSLEQRFKQKTCKINSVCFYSRNGEYIYMIVSMDGHAVEEWAEKLEIDIEISPKKAIVKGRQDPSFHLAHRTYCPKLDDKTDNTTPKQVILKDLFNETIVLDKLDMTKWENIHIGFSKYVGNIYVENKIPERLYLRILYDVLTRTESKFDVAYLTRLSEHPLCGFFSLSGKNHPLKKYGHMYNVGNHEHGHEHIGHDEKDHGKIFNVLMQWDGIIEDIRLYYGEANGFYFAFVLHYTKWLTAFSVIGVIWFVVQCIEGTISAKGSLVFSFLAVCWATLCHEHFKRKEWELRVKWGMLRVNVAEIPKPLRNGTFIVSEMDGEVTQVFQSKYKYYGRIIASFSTILLCIACVLSAVFGIWILKSKWGSTTKYSIMIGILNAIQIHIFNLIYTKLATRLNDWEEHRKRSHEYDALVVKRILFIMINSFNSLFYLAVYASYPTDNARLNAIRCQLITLFATAIVIQNFFEVAVPTLKTWIKRKFFDKTEQLYELDDFDVDLTADWRQHTRVRLQSHSISYDDMDEEHSDDQLTQISAAYDEVKDELSEMDAIISRNKEILKDIELQSDQDDSPDVLDNTAEIVVLHGYIIIFAIIFPIMPLLGIVNNYFELRIDLYNLLHSRRPCPRASNGIGIWKNVMSIINTIAIFSNFGLLAFRTDEVSTTYFHTHSGGISTRDIVEFFLGTCAITWVIKQGVKMIIPDKSLEVKAAITRQTICEKHLLLNKIKTLLAKQIKKKRE